MNVLDSVDLHGEFLVGSFSFMDGIMIQRNQGIGSLLK